MERSQGEEEGDIIPLIVEGTTLGEFIEGEVPRREWIRTISPELQKIVDGDTDMAMNILMGIPLNGTKRSKAFFRSEQVGMTEPKTDLENQKVFMTGSKEEVMKIISSME